MRNWCYVGERSRESGGAISGGFATRLAGGLPRIFTNFHEEKRGLNHRLTRIFTDFSHKKAQKIFLPRRHEGHEEKGGDLDLRFSVDYLLVWGRLDC